MNERDVDLSWAIFSDLPDEPETRYGAMLVNWNGQTGRTTYDMAQSYRTAAFRLLDEASRYNESWESVDPILFCFRHALELNMKAIHRGPAKRSHGLQELAAHLHERLVGCYRQSQLDWLRDRIREFDTVDPRSTAFRYDDVANANVAPEVWVDFAQLRRIMNAIFSALDKIRLDDFERVGEKT
ncbi:hypothetical protein [Mesorhizobium sp.]|uniref:hypothetical protein n=1 Tax=Mesorhizobium sp. TaxID=1871066 RepID=UPI00120ED7D7|nr:hypothetical protein [Mesorhizobium sp.]TIO04399.1 MAG: hypothetical protein E5X88_32015 [Mesorhizobium sp.]TIO36448.1 MAG: hypothetical protein E5X89_00030 [Mesorhizobium sp.]